MQTTAPKYRKGHRVNIINQKMSGTFFLEGEAVVIRPVRGVDQQYLVDFGDGMPVERFVDPAAQDDPAGLVSRLNDTAA